MNSYNFFILEIKLANYFPIIWDIQLHKKLQQPHYLVALGIIYGDIGTSPLYVMKAIVDKRAISELLVYGGISCVFLDIDFSNYF